MSATTPKLMSGLLNEKRPAHSHILLCGWRMFSLLDGQKRDFPKTDIKKGTIVTSAMSRMPTPTATLTADWYNWNFAKPILEKPTNTAKPLKKTVFPAH